jgi:hypothetical protein
VDDSAIFFLKCEMHSASLEKLCVLQYHKGREVAMILAELGAPIREIKSKIHETWRRL